LAHDHPRPLVHRSSRAAVGGFHYIDSEGRKRSPCRWRNITEAKAERRQIEARIDRGEHVAPAKRSVAEVAEAWWETKTKLRPNSRITNENRLRLHVLPALGSKPIQKVDVHAIATYIRSKEAEGCAAASIGKDVDVINQIFRYAKRHNFVAGNPVAELERDERPQGEARGQEPLGPGALALLLESFEDERFFLFYLTLASSGLRIGEAMALRWRHLEASPPALHVKATMDRNSGELGPPKSKNSRRRVILLPKLVERLNDFRGRTEREDDFIFPGLRHGLLSRELARAARRAGITARVTPHTFRHTYGSKLVAAGLDIGYVARQMGDTVETIMRVYTHEYESVQHEARARGIMESEFGGLLSGGEIVTELSPRALPQAASNGHA
jgi:integrase